MAQVCDVVYVMMCDRIERWAMVGQLSAVFAITQGAKVPVPDPDKARAEFDEWLVSPLDGPPSKGDRRQLELEAALGL